VVSSQKINQKLSKIPFGCVATRSFKKLEEIRELAMDITADEYQRWKLEKSVLLEKILLNFS
jgi:hypothetical protein